MELLFLIAGVAAGFFGRPKFDAWRKSKETVAPVVPVAVPVDKKD